MEFIILTTVFWIATAGFMFLLWISIQPGNWAEKWQNKLRAWDLSGKEFLYRTMGGCAACSSHMIAQVSFPVYITFILSVYQWPLSVAGSILWYGMYVAISTNLNLIFISKLYK